MNTLIVSLSLILTASITYSQELPSLKILAMEQLSQSIEVLPDAKLRNKAYQDIKKRAGNVIDNPEYCYKNFEGYFEKTRRWNYLWKISGSAACDVDFVHLCRNESLLVAGNTSDITMWDTTGELQITMNYSIPVTALTVSADGTTFITGHANGYVGCARLKQDEQSVNQLDTYHVSERNHTAAIVAVDYCENQQKIVSADKVGTLSVWNSDMKCQSTLDRRIPGINSIKHNENELYVSTIANTLHKISIQDTQYTTSTVPVQASEFTVKNNYKIIGVAPCQITLFDVTKTKPLCCRKANDTTTVLTALSNIALSHDGSTALFGSEVNATYYLNIVNMYGNRIHAHSFRKFILGPLVSDNGYVFKKRVKKIAVGKNLLVILFENLIYDHDEFCDSYSTIELYKPFTLQEILDYSGSKTSHL